MTGGSPTSAPSAAAANISARAAVSRDPHLVARSDAQEGGRRRRRHQGRDGFTPRRGGTFDSRRG
jgi:hypothetical protein